MLAIAGIAYLASRTVTELHPVERRIQLVFVTLADRVIFLVVLLIARCLAL
jgi:hypothetical protein